MTVVDSSDEINQLVKYRLVALGSERILNENQLAS